MISGRGDMSNFMGVGIFWIGLNRADLGCWRLTEFFNNSVGHCQCWLSSLMLL